MYSTFEHLTQQRYTMSIIQSRVLYSACIVRLNRPLVDSKLIRTITIYKQKPVGTRFVQMVSKNSRMGNSVGIGAYHLQNSFKFTKGVGREAKSWGNANDKHVYPFGNSVWEFWTTFQEIPFSREIFRLGRPK